ncbi:tripartite motif-containing protein 2-like [Ptychodera flava]|uniref:tripartite motif-containing protein 2-like n=1 Tax=Ptychodera flava TaxID=63121 RepID=UPI003969C5E2
MYGSYLKTVGGPGKGPSEFRFPLYIAASQDGYIYISDSVSQAVKVFDSNGKYVRQLGIRGQKAGHIFWPTGVAVDKEGNVIVAEFQDVLGGGHNRLQRFKPDGAFVDRVDDISESLSHPEGLAVSSCSGNTQKLYVSDWGSNCIKVYQIFGT